MTGVYANVAPALRARGWHPFPVHPETKLPAVKGWNALCLGAAPDPAWLRLFAGHSAALAIPPGVVAVDHDEADPLGCRMLARATRAILGPSPLHRLGGPGKLGVGFYRVAAGTVRTQHHHKLDILTAVAQVVAYGPHASGAPYWWPIANPLDIGPDDTRLPLVTAAQVDELALVAAGIIGPRPPREAAPGAPNNRCGRWDGLAHFRALCVAHDPLEAAGRVLLLAHQAASRRRLAIDVGSSLLGKGYPADGVSGLLERTMAPQLEPAEFADLMAWLGRVIARDQRPVDGPIVAVPRATATRGTGRVAARR